YDFAKRKEERQEKSVPVLKELEDWLKDNIIQVLPQSAIGKAITYTLGLWPRLMRYTEYGQCEIDNNLIENSIRPVALGRKNYLFAGSHDGARRAAMIYSFLGTCKINNVNPTEWLTDVLNRIYDYKANKLAELLPSNWKPLNI
ncbi:MAG TPA: transposase, partial [Bacteroidales bacterium]